MILRGDFWTRVVEFSVVAGLRGSVVLFGMCLVEVDSFIRTRFDAEIIPRSFTRLG